MQYCRIAGLQIGSVVVDVMQILTCMPLHLCCYSYCYIRCLVVFYVDTMFYIRQCTQIAFSLTDSTVYTVSQTLPQPPPPPIHTLYPHPSSFPASPGAGVNVLTVLSLFGGIPAVGSTEMVDSTSITLYPAGSEMNGGLVYQKHPETT